MKYSHLMMSLGMSCCLSLSAQADSNKVWITIDKDAAVQAQHVQAVLAPPLQSLLDSGKTFSSPVLIYQVEDSKLSDLSTLMHQDHQRCGGYIVHDSYQEAVTSLQGPAEFFAFSAPPIQQQSTVNALLPSIQASEIKSTISSLSNFTNRFYNTNSGKESANWLLSHWQGLANGHAWASAEAYSHASWGQDSVILKIIGSEKPNEIIVMGGHLDSTAGSSTREGTVAPGADDDASGIASLTNVAKAILSSGKQPQRTIHIMGYAAEEVGLRGSKEIAQSYKSSGKNVVAALQLDMTNYAGSAKNIYFMTDYVNADFTRYMKSLLDEYQPQVTYGDDRCGYACSDHASWYNQGYPTTMPFESTFNGANSNIHSRYDTLAQSDAEAQNSVPFAKLALSFAVEMSNPRVSTSNLPPVADFNLSCDQLNCQFDGGLSRDGDGQINSYSWSFGDNSQSNNKQPSHQYTSTGTYQVTLTVTDNQGATDTTNQTITVTTDSGSNPIANIEASCTELTCQLDGSKSTDDGSIVSYSWNLGDGNLNTSTQLTHQYSQSGSYQVSLTVTDNEGFDNTSYKTLVVSTGNNDCPNKENWNINASYALGDEVVYENNLYEAIWWSTGARPDVYTNVWQHQQACGDTPPPQTPIAGFDFSINKLQVQFSDQSLDDQGIVSHSWAFGDGATSQQQNPQHTYTADGSYQVSLTVIDNDDLSNTIVKTVTVKDDSGNNCQVAEWSASQVYNNGDSVSYQGNEYKANWWNQNSNPAENSGPWQVWTLVGTCN